MKHRIFALLSTQLLCLILIGLLLVGDFSLGYTILWGILSFFFLLYVPGYRISYMFFTSEDLSKLERFILSFLISIVFVLICSYYLKYFGVDVNSITVYLFMTCIVFLSSFVVLIKYRGESTEHFY